MGTNGEKRGLKFTLSQKCCRPICSLTEKVVRLSVSPWKRMQANLDPTYGSKYFVTLFNSDVLKNNAWPICSAPEKNTSLSGPPWKRMQANLDPSYITNQINEYRGTVKGQIRPGSETVIKSQIKPILISWIIGYLLSELMLNITNVKYKKWA